MASYVEQAAPPSSSDVELPDSGQDDWEGTQRNLDKLNFESLPEIPGAVEKARAFLRSQRVRYGHLSDRQIINRFLQLTDDQPKPTTRRIRKSV